MDDKKCFNAFKKCNDIGKKLSSDSIYIMANGCVISDGNTDDSSASGYAISFMSDKLIKDLDALTYIPLIINGNDFYDLSKEYDFDRFEIDDDYLYIIFKGLYADDKDFYNDFIQNAVENGFNDVHVASELESEFQNDLDLYEFYINYKKNYKPKDQFKEFTFKAKILKKENEFINNFNNIINDITLSTNTSCKDLENEIYTKIMESTKPVVLKFKNDDNVEVFKLRLMKSLFKTAIKSSKIRIRVLEHHEIPDVYFTLIYIDNKTFNTVIIYKALNY